MSGRWYGFLGSWKGATGRVQIDSPTRLAADGRKPLRLPEPVLRLAQAEYEHHFGNDQDYERMQERAGLSVLEVVALLADYVERLGGTGTKPREEPGDG